MLGWAKLFSSQRTGSLACWWLRDVVGTVDYSDLVDRVRAEGGWNGHYAFMTLMSGGIAILGLLLSSPAVVIGAMLISPLMGPIVALGLPDRSVRLAAGGARLELQWILSQDETARP